MAAVCTHTLRLVRVPTHVLHARAALTRTACAAVASSLARTHARACGIQHPAAGSVAAPWRQSSRRYTTNANVRVVRFLVPKDTALDILSDRDRILAPTPPRDSKEVTQYLGSTVRPVYLPFHVFDVVVDTKFTGEVGYVHTRRTKDSTTTYTNWYKVRGSSRGNRHSWDATHMQAYADTRYSPKLVACARAPNAIGDDLSKTVGLDYKDESGKGLLDDGIEVDVFTLRRNVSWSRVLDRVYEKELDRAKTLLRRSGSGRTGWMADTGSADRTRDVRLTSFRMRHKSTASVYLPAYVLDYVLPGRRDSDGKPVRLRKAVGGVTGELEGDLLYSPLKVGACAATVTGLVALGAEALFVGAVAMTFMPAVAGVALGGLAGWFLGRQLPLASRASRLRQQKALADAARAMDEEAAARGMHFEHDDEGWDSDGVRVGEGASDSEEDEPLPEGFFARMFHDPIRHTVRTRTRSEQEYIDALARRRARMRAYREMRSAHHKHSSAQVREREQQKSRQREFVFTSLAASRHLTVLGLASGCTLGNVKDAFRRRIMMCHPDHRPEAEKEAANAETRELITAYRALCNIEAQERKRTAAR